MNKLKEFLEKIKNLKHKPMLLAVFVGVVVCVFYFSFLTPTKSDTNSDNSTQQTSSAEEYVDMLENKLANVLANISGVKSCDVIITLESGFDYVYATDTETKTTISGSNETSITTETVILVSNEPIVVKEIYPTIKGVVVVASGAEDITVKLNILSAVETVLEVDSNNITILS